ncbi:MAG TPA: amino acid adenylation domain-containing protein, partial [Pirellulales bacterium]|nr:amino acid adenylation domain-containing protein [Pirellulales bacterium]
MESWSSTIEGDVPVAGNAATERAPGLANGAVARQRRLADTRLEQLVGTGVLAHPNAVAVITADEQVTYAELQRRAVGLARHLRERGVKPGELVGLSLERSVDMVVGAYGILLAGGAYVPLDPDYPADRLGFMLDDAGFKVLVTHRAQANRFCDRAIEVVAVDELASEPTEQVLEQLPEMTPDALAYVIYTSGSTGRPKGVMITHRAAANTIIDINARFQVGVGDCVLALSSLCFDLSVYDIFGLLAVGGTIVIPDPKRHFEPAYWAELIARHQVTVWNSVPAFMEMFTTHAAGRCGDGFSSLRLVMLSGDWIPVSLPDRIRAIAPRTKVISLGGATEASIWSIFYPIDAVDPTWKSIPYGRALANQAMYVLNDDLRQCEVGETGEICIGGDGVAVGYWNRPDLNSQKFVPDSRSDSADGRLYRTGDLGRYFEDGDIEFLGRIDHQVKIRGFRVELGEIETALVRHSAVNEAAVVARQGASGSKSLVAFLVLSPQAAIGDKEIGDFLRQTLPEYMIPARFVRLDRMPLNVNGKVDRSALPDSAPRTCADEPENRRELPEDFAPPRDEIETQLVSIWERELGVRPIGIRDTFLELGGDSLSAVGVFARVEREFRRSLPPASLLERPTIEQLAELLRDPQLGKQTACLVVLQESDAHPPLVCLPGISGNLWEFRRLAKRLGPDIPLYGLQPVGLDGELKPHETIE